MPKGKKCVTGLYKLIMAVTKKNLEEIRHLTEKDADRIYTVLDSLGLSPVTNHPYGKILAMRYGLHGEQLHTLIRLGQVFGISATAIHHAYVWVAIKNIRRNPDWYGVFTGTLISKKYSKGVAR